LDIGCGSGRLLRRAAGRWPAAQIVGIDPAPGMIQVAQNLTPAGHFSQAHAESLPLESASVDLVLSSISLHHWRDSALGAREIARVLRCGGLFCLADISCSAWLATIFHSKAKSKRAMGCLLLNAGFSIQRQQAMLAGFVVVSLAQKGL